MKYSFTCPACNQSVTVDAETDQEAIEKIIEEGKDHAAKVHPELGPLSEDQMRAFVQVGLKKHEE